MSYIEGDSPIASLSGGRRTAVSGSPVALCRLISMQIFMLVKG